MALGPKQMGEAIIRNMKAKTGRSIEGWIDVVSSTNLREKKEVMEFLKKEQGLGHFQAQKVFEHFLGSDDYANPNAFVDQLFSSKQTRELYEFAKSKILEIDKGINVQPCQTYIPFYGKNQFALLAPSGKDALVLGLHLPDEGTSSEFTAPCKLGSKRINRQIILSITSDLSASVLAAIRSAYQNNEA